MSIALPRHAEVWLADYVRSVVRASRERRGRRGVVDIFFSIVDHFEPLHGQATFEQGLRRVHRWVQGYPAMASQFTDADGRHPQHTFFFPIEQYRAEFLDPLAELCRSGFGEVEVHLHHDHDSAENLRDQLYRFTRTLHERHGLLPCDGTGRIRYGFVHGNWALANSLPDGRWCGVDGELAVLRETGCYADFTMPAAPSPAQARTVNQIYYADCGIGGRRAHDRGFRAAVGCQPSPDRLLLVQGPLAVTWRGARRRLLPRLEAGDLRSGNPPTVERFADWLSCGICVEGQPGWVFVKVHTHGAPDANAEMLLGPHVAAFHRNLLATFNDGSAYRLHYMTTREMVNVIHATEAGWRGSARDVRDIGLAKPSA